MSDIFIKSTTGSGGWKIITNLFVKSTTGSGGWAAAAGVWIKNTTQWLKVWPLSGIFATRVPYIGYLAADAYAGRMPNVTYPAIRIGDSYFGNNADWDLNGWTASSYTYRWKLYTEFNSEISTLRSGTAWSVVAPNSTGSGQDQLPYAIWTSTNSTNADNQFLAFEVTANNPSNSQYNGLSLSTKVKVVREKPINLTASLSTNSPAVGTAITYSSTWETAEAYKARDTYVQWYTNSTSTAVGGTYVGSGSSYTPVSADNGKYIYVIETRQNSGTDYDLGISTGIEVSRVTTGVVGVTPTAFTYSLTNVSSVTTPSAPIQQRVSSISNTVLIEMGSSFPSDTELYDLWSYGTGSSAGGTLANPATQIVTTLNQYNSSGNFVITGGSFDTLTNISSSASNSPISTFTKATGTSRILQFNVSSTTGAQSWRISYTVSGASSGNGSLTLNTNSIPATITIFGASNPTVTINGITSYSGLNQTGTTKIGTAGSQTSLSTITKPTAFSTTSSSNYSFYVTPVTPTITIAANSGVSATAGTINWTSTNQASFSSTGTFSATGTIATSITNASLTASTTYTGTITVTSSTGHTASANYSLTTSAPPTWTITWDAAGGGEGTQLTTQNIGLSHTAPDPGPRLGFDFSYYRYPASGGTDPVFVSIGGSYTPTANVTFGAIWATKTYSVSYNANLGTGAPSPQTKTHGVTLTLSSTTPTRATVGSTSYAFNGWNTASDGTGTNYSAGGSYTANAAVTLYAKWTATTVVVSVPSGGTVSISTNTGNYTVGSIITFSTTGWANTPTSYSLRLYNGTNPVLTSDPQRGSTVNGTSGTYTIVSGDVPNYFKAFATASNSAGTSTEASSTQVGPAVATFVTPSSEPPQISNNQLGFVRSGTSVTWYSDYPSVSGDVSYIIGMEWQIRTTNSTTTTPLNTGTYASGGSGAGSQGNRTTYITYPGNGTYPYAAEGTIWAFRIRSTENTAATATSTSARFGRARVIMMGTNGTVYFGTWSTNV